jgi:flagellar protein FlaI
MVRELDVVAIQQQLFVGDRRVRRNVGISELERDDEGSTGVRDVYEWNPATDGFQGATRSKKLREIMYMNGWDEDRLQLELSRRERLLRYMIREDISDYESFETIVWEYDRKPERVVELLERGELERLT